MKKASFFLAAALCVMCLDLSGQYFKASFSFNQAEQKLSFYVKPINGNITSAIGGFQFAVRSPTVANVVFGAITNNNANTMPATGFPGLNMVTAATTYTGQNLQYFNFTSTIVSQTYVQDTEYLVFSIILGGNTNTNLELITNYINPNPDGTPTFVVSDGAGLPLIDPALTDIFYPFQTTNANDIYYLLAVVLPLELTQFEARAKAKTIDLFWETETETAFYGFEIERSEDGENFRTIGFEKAKGGSFSTSYAFSDADVKPGVDYFYRLKMLDRDGQSTFSKIRTARIEGRQTGAKIYPSPASEMLKVEFGDEKPDHLAVFDGGGKLLFSRSNLGETGADLDVSALADGWYLLRLFSKNDGMEMGSFRFLKEGK